MKILIIGGAGFIGINAASHFAASAAEVTIYDNLSRPGSYENVTWLQKQYPSVRFVHGDIRFGHDVARFFEGRTDDLVLMLAGQVAVTTSVEDPRRDFECNALGTFNVLEALRLAGSTATLIYTSTNKVYGGMEDLVVIEKDRQYRYQDFPDGIAEDRLLDFHSPYGCSKGAADQYVRDYARIFGLNTVVMRQSCIYGPRQFGVEDQGWVAWFTIQAILGRPITIFGDGKQVRDVLFVTDLVELYQRAHERIGEVSGQVFNVGGGTFCLSLLELIEILEELCGQRLEVNFGPLRPGDQKVYISDIRRVRNMLGWEPKTDARAGVAALHQWVTENRQLLETVLQQRVGGPTRGT